MCRLLGFQWVAPIFFPGRIEAGKFPVGVKCFESLKLFQRRRCRRDLKIKIQYRQQIIAGRQPGNKMEMVMIQLPGTGTIMHRERRNQMQLAGLEPELPPMVSNDRLAVQNQPQPRKRTDNVPEIPPAPGYRALDRQNPQIEGMK